MSKTSLDYLVQDIYAMSNCQSAEQVEANVYDSSPYFSFDGATQNRNCYFAGLSLSSLLSIFIK